MFFTFLAVVAVYIIAVFILQDIYFPFVHMKVIMHENYPTKICLTVNALWFHTSYL